MLLVWISRFWNIHFCGLLLSPVGNSNLGITTLAGVSSNKIHKILRDSIRCLFACSRFTAIFSRLAPFAWTLSLLLRLCDDSKRFQFISFWFQWLIYLLLTQFLFWFWQISNSRLAPLATPPPGAPVSSTAGLATLASNKMLINETFAACSARR